MDPAERVSQLVEPLLRDQGIELVDVVFGRGLLRISIDREGGVDLDAIADASERISRLLDENDPVPGGRYTLEVSSPGVERPLRTPDQFRRFVGATVAVKTLPGVEGDRRVQGRLDDADDESVVVAGRRLAYADIERAHTVFEWGPQPKPGKKPVTKKAAR